jgi:hypothetical protein
MANHLKTNKDDYDYIMNYTSTYLPNMKFINIMTRFDALFVDIKVCQQCASAHIKTDECCSKKCKSLFAASKHKRINDETNAKYLTEDGIMCRVCNDYCRHDIQQHIRKEHALSVPEYKKQYASEVISDKLKSEMSNKIIGEKNPGYNHNGKFSALSKNFVKYVDMSDEEIEKSKIDIGNKISESNKNNGNNDTTLNYWLNLGYDEVQANQKLSERQSTFSLEKCIEKHGSEIGLQKWTERQEKWQNTLCNKTQEEIDAINMKKSKGRMAQLFSGNEAIKFVPALLYYLRFYDINTNETLFWKIGITTKPRIKGRFGNTYKYGLNYEIINEERGLTFYEAFKKEQKILRENREYRVIIDHNGFKTSEAFKTNILCQ